MQHTGILYHTLLDQVTEENQRRFNCVHNVVLKNCVLPASYGVTLLRPAPGCINSILNLLVYVNVWIQSEALLEVHYLLSGF